MHAKNISGLKFPFLGKGSLYKPKSAGTWLNGIKWVCSALVLESLKNVLIYKYAWNQKLYCYVYRKNIPSTWILNYAISDILQ